MSDDYADGVQRVRGQTLSQAVASYLDLYDEDVEGNLFAKAQLRQQFREFRSVSTRGRSELATDWLVCQLVERRGKEFIARCGRRAPASIGTEKARMSVWSHEHDCTVCFGTTQAQHRQQVADGVRPAPAPGDLQWTGPAPTSIPRDNW